MGDTNIQIPSKAVDDGEDIGKPTTELLSGLNLLPSDEELKQAGQPGAALGGPPQSVAVIEAGATAMTKAWSAGLGAGVIAAWGSVRLFYDGQPEANQRMMLLGAAIATAAALLAIGYILGSDVRGRSAASVATIEARAALAQSMIETSAAAYDVGAEPVTAEVVPLPSPLRARHLAKSSESEPAWMAIAIQLQGTESKYLLAKGTSSEWVPMDQVSIEPINWS